MPAIGCGIPVSELGKRQYNEGLIGTQFTNDSAAEFGIFNLTEHSKSQ